MFGINALFTIAGALSGVFVNVYLWQHSDFMTICRYQLVCFALTPVFFMLGGWYAQARDRLHIYRIGLVLSASFYALLLVLQEQAAQYHIWLGVFAAINGGIFWAGSNTLSYDMTAVGRREYYIGLMGTISGVAGLIGPIVGGVIIEWAPEVHLGYQALFGAVVIIYSICILLSFALPKDNVRRPFRIRRALFPKREQRDWRLALWISLSLAGSFNIFPLLLTLLMFMQTNSEIKVGGFASFQTLVALTATFIIGRTAAPGNRLKFMFWGVATLLASGCLMFFPITILVLCAFGLLRSLAQPLFGIPHSGLNYEIISKDAEDPSQRIEYICVWEIPLAIGRVIMMATMMFLYDWLNGNEVAIRIALFLMCAVRIITYQLAKRTSPIQAELEPVEPVGEPVLAEEEA